jgi:hypothetical protein
MGTPFIFDGTLSRSSCSRIPEKVIRASPNPMAQYGHTKYRAVGGNQGQKDPKGLVERWTDFLEDDFNQLHQGCDDQDEGDGTHVHQVKGGQHGVVYQVSDQGGDNHDKSNCTRHPDGGFHLAGNADEGADAQELVEYDVADKYSSYDDDYIFHGQVVFSLIMLASTMR